MPFRACLFAAAVPTALGWAVPARATPNFPAVIQQVVGSAAPPPCTICHNNPNGGLGTVTTVFGMYMRSRGLVPYDENSLRNALAAASAEQHVSNGDGISDTQALREGLDPNAGSGGAPTQSPLPPPDYGCGAQVASGQGGSASGPFLVAAGIAIVRRRRRSMLRACA
jgi:MYXO-CTERM domain-containing protein